MLKTPLTIINFKTYGQTTGKNAVKLAKTCEKVARKSGAEIAVAVQAADIAPVAAAVSIPVLAQHADNIEHGKNTGFILPESIKEAGASGTLLNHAEHKIDHKVLAATIRRCKKLGITTIVCAASRKESAEVARFSPDFIAVELPELIGTLVSVSRVNPEVVRSSIEAIKKVKDIPVLCGAGVANGEDVRKALQLGTKGVLVATAVDKADDPEAALVDLVNGLK
jgi:triosephosphate isomerase (TIM)